MLLVALMLFVVATATLQFIEYAETLDEAEETVPSVGVRYSEEATTDAKDGRENGTAVEVELIFGGPIKHGNLSVGVDGEPAMSWNGSGYEKAVGGNGKWSVGETLRLSCHGDPCEPIGSNETLKISRRYMGSEIGMSSYSVGS